MKKIAIFQSDMRLGGMEKSLYNLLHSRILDEYLVDVYLFERDCFYNMEDLPSNIHINFLSPLPRLCKILPVQIVEHMRIEGIYSRRHYDIAIDFSGYSRECANCVKRVSADSKVMWIHNDLEQRYIHELKFRIMWLLSKSKLRYYNCFAAVSEGIIEPFRRLSNCKNAKVYCVPNIISAKEILEKAKEEIDIRIDNKRYNIIFVGRLCHAKGFDILLDLMSDLVKRRTDVKLYILGSGPQYKKIKRIIAEKRLFEYVEMVNAVSNPYPYMAAMDGLILMSRYEGQGIVLTEGKILGLQLYFPKSLERYNMFMKGSDHILERLEKAVKTEKKIDLNEEYDDYVTQQYRNLFSVLSEGVNKPDEG